MKNQPLTFLSNLSFLIISEKYTSNLTKLGWEFPQRRPHFPFPCTTSSICSWHFTFTSCPHKFQPVPSVCYKCYLHKVSTPHPSQPMPNNRAHVFIQHSSDSTLSHYPAFHLFHCTKALAIDYLLKLEWLSFYPTFSLTPRDVYQVLGADMGQYGSQSWIGPLITWKMFLLKYSCCSPQVKQNTGYQDWVEQAKESCLMSCFSSARLKKFLRYVLQQCKYNKHHWKVLVKIVSMVMSLCSLPVEKRNSFFKKLSYKAVCNTEQWFWFCFKNIKTTNNTWMLTICQALI